MRTLAEHRSAVLALVAPLPATTVPVGSALGLVLAADVVARVDLPGFDNSAMDGYAVRAAELAGATAQTPVVLPVAGDVAAGDTTHHVLRAGQVLRIMTGAPMPEGADAVVPVELTDGGATEVALHLAPEVGRSLRHRGEDVRTGDTVLPAGSRLGPGHLALAAAANVAELSVHPRPRVVVITTGDELVAPGSVLEHGQIVNSNHVMLCALVEAAGAEVAGSAHLRDDAAEVRALLDDLPGAPDLVITTGGVSMGVYEHGQGGAHRRRRGRVRQGRDAPGDAAGLRGRRPSRTPVVTLPGNPVARSRRSTCSCCRRCGGSPGSTPTPTAPSRPSPRWAGPPPRARSS